MKLIYSAGGYAREFHRLVTDQFPGEEIRLIDDAPETVPEGLTGGPAISYAEAKSFGDEIVIGFSGAALRRRKTEMALRDGFRLYSVTATTAVIGENCQIGPGAIISDFAMVTADARIGESFQCNIYSYVAHDCVVGDYVTLAPRVSVNGRVIIEDDVYIGTGATILPGKPGKFLRIGKGAVIGAHALVTKDVAPGTTVIGQPAKPIGA